ncbi:3-dehydrosphinganine reductase [Paramarasmius palmivorus]|uniref:3-dehydrosphinganine reductase n=1 Tax=Paramarasmius palmivorus TaxID=297713 RepID=A0AAW0CP35_9AGAR
MSTAAATLGAVLVVSVLLAIAAMGFTKKWDPRGKHCYITGGSAGLGLSLAVLLTKKGAHVSIVARDKEKLRLALDELEKSRQNPDQILKSYSFSLTDPKSSQDALEAASQVHGGKAPDAVFLCAGTAHLGYFVEQDHDTLKKGMESSYWVAAYSALAYVKRIVQEKKKGKLVFVSSVMGYMSFVGYSTYAPAKWRITVPPTPGLAETLRSELLLYNSTVHVCFPSTIYSPGYYEENKTKPPVTLKIEEADGGQTPEQVAKGLLKGVQRGNFHVTTEILGNIFRASTRGVSPRNNPALDVIYGLIGSIGLPIWRRSIDSIVVEHRKDHQNYLQDRGVLH